MKRNRNAKGSRKRWGKEKTRSGRTEAGLEWSERRDSNSRHSPWQGEALPLSYARAFFAASRLLPGVRHSLFPTCGKSGGEGGIRTPGTVTRTRAFQARSLNHSDTSPEWQQVGKATHSLFGKQSGFPEFFMDPQKVPGRNRKKAIAIFGTARIIGRCFSNLRNRG